jgi:hypothetical protein
VAQSPAKSSDSHFGQRFLYLSVGIPFEFPRPGRYQLSVTADERLTGGVFHYNVEVGRQAEG